MIGGASRRDSWDAIAKTKSLLSYGSLESLANLTSNGATTEHSNYVNNNYRNGNTSIHQNSSSNFSSTQKFSTTEYGTTQKYSSESQNGRVQTHGILKNKNNNHYKSVDAIDSAHERYTQNSQNGVSAFRTVSGKNALVAGNALEILPVHKPMSFTLDPSLDTNNVTVLVTGKILTFNYI